MPFDYLYRPSLQLSLLKAALERKGISARVCYENLMFAKRIGAVLYALIANEDPRTLSLVGEWLFSEALFGKKDREKAFIELLRRNYPEDYVQAVLKAKEEVLPYLNECVKHVITHAPRIVAFSTHSDQITRHTVASLALIKRVKEILPEVFSVIGGPNWDSKMSLEAIRQFPFLNAVIAGETDEICPELIQRVMNSEKTMDLPGTYIQNSAPPPIRQAPPVRDLDALPVPCYDDYFEQLKSSDLDHYDPPRIVFETSRGCW